MSIVLRASLLLLAVLAVASVWLSDLPPLLMLAPAVLLFASMPTASAPGELLLRNDGSAALVSETHEATPIEQVRVQIRGPLCVLGYREGGRNRRHVLLPDTLDASSRRKLLLWTDRHGGSEHAGVRRASV